MPLTIITDKSDNGNEFLCRDCSFAAILSGTQTQEYIVCSNVHIAGEGIMRIAFPVTKCSQHRRASIAAGGKNYQQMRRTAYYVDASEENGKLVLITPEKARERNLWYD